MGIIFAFSIAVLIVLIVILGLIVFGHRKLNPEQAMIITTHSGNKKVVFNNSLIIPGFQKTEIVDMTAQAVEIHEFPSKDIVCKDDFRIDIDATFFVRIKQAQEDILKVVKSNTTPEKLFKAQFLEAIKTVAKQMRFDELSNEHQRFCTQLTQFIGKDLNGYDLEEIHINYLEKTPLSALDNNNLADAKSIKKLIEAETKAQILLLERQKEAEMIMLQQERDILLAEAQAKTNQAVKEQMTELERQQRELAIQIEIAHQEAKLKNQG